MATSSGTTVLHVVSSYRFRYQYDREAQVKQAIQQLSDEGKRVVNIVDGPITPIGPFGNVYSDITIIWEESRDEKNNTAPDISVVTPKHEEKASVIVTSENFKSILSRIDLFLEDGEWDKAKSYCDAALDFDSTNAEVYLRLVLAELKICKKETLPHCEQPFSENSNFKKAMRFGNDKLKAELNSYISYINERNETERLHGVYNRSVSEMNTADSESAYKAAAATFKTISGFKDADFLAEQCLERAEVCRKDAVYASARSHIKENTVSGYEAAIITFSAIPGWKDSDEQIHTCQKKIEAIKAKEEADRLERERQAEQGRIAAEEAAKKRKKIAAIVIPIITACIAFTILLKTVIIPNQKYNAAVELYNGGKYEEAIVAFEALDDYKDSKTQIEKCKTAIKDEKYYAAMDLLKTCNYDAAYALLEEIGNNDLIASSKYDRAVALMDSGDYAAAYILLNGLNYNDSANKLKMIEESDAWIKICPVGKTVTFGSYEQDNNTANGKEAIEWIVLEWEADKVLLISKYALDSQQYQEESTQITWEECSLNRWLNRTFAAAAFNSEEKDCILYYSAAKCKVFLLSIEEAKDYLNSDSLRQCKGTAYCYAQGAYRTTDGNCKWWLRTPARVNVVRADVILENGCIQNSGSLTNSNDVSVRPAIWIDLSKIDLVQLSFLCG